MNSENREKILDVQGLTQRFRLNRRQVLTAVDNVSFHIYKGETFGLVGESGCGKTTTGRSILRIYEPSEGKVIYKGQNVANLKKADMNSFCHSA